MDAAEFYNRLAPYYHLIYPDWQHSINRQGQMLQALIEKHGPKGAKEILDVSCGIGTQSIALAQNGYRVTASDLSAQAVQRARIEAANRNLQIQFSVADMRHVDMHFKREFDVVLSCDNSVPHLLSDADILQAFRVFYNCTKRGGSCIISVRDYEREPQEKQVVKPYGVRREGNVQYLLFQVWEFTGEIYQTSLYLVEDHGKETCVTHVMRSYYYAVKIGTLMDLMKEAGYRNVIRLDDAFFQPVILGKK